MAKPLISKKRAHALSSALFLFGLAFLFLSDSWWPGTMLVIGVPLALKQFLLGKVSDSLLSLAIFVGFFIIAQFDISWKILLPILFVTAAIYILCREWVEGSIAASEAEIDTDLNKEIEEENEH
ncbi:MAG: hypothetical protein AAF443_06960 [Chlamydiota bacterium]